MAEKMTGKNLAEEDKRNQNKVGQWIELFYQSNYFNELSGEQKINAEAIISMFADYMYIYFDLAPDEWNSEDLEECCLDIMPRKVSADEEFFISIEPVLSAFFNFAAENKLIANGSELAQGIKGLNNKIVENASNQENWGPAKSLVMAARAAGVDITNANEMNSFIVLFNMQQMVGIKIEHKMKNKKLIKIGRNDPCYCGSGKKYKKCCLRIQ